MLITTDPLQLWDEAVSHYVGIRYECVGQCHGVSNMSLRILRFYPLTRFRFHDTISTKNFDKQSTLLNKKLCANLGG